MSMFLDKPHEFTPPPVDPVSRTVRVSSTLKALLVIMVIGGGAMAGVWAVTEGYIPEFWKWTASPTNTNATIRVNRTPVVATTSFVDSDTDGLYDEAEMIYGTDPAVADTDGDGYSDGQEVKNGYEPLIATAGKRMIDTALVDVVTRSVASPIVVSSGMSSAERQRYYLVYDGVSTSYFGADGTLAAQCTNDNQDGKCGTLPNEIRTDFSRTFTGETSVDAFHSPF